MAVTVDPKKLAENLRRLIIFPAQVMRYPTIDTEYFRKFGDALYVKITISKDTQIEAHDPLKPSIIPPTAKLVCPLQEIISNKKIALQYTIRTLNAILRNVPLTIELPSVNHTLLQDIDCDTITSESQLPDLTIPLIASHKPTQWISLTYPIPLRLLYPQTALNELWTQSQVGEGIQFRQWL